MTKNNLKQFFQAFSSDSAIETICKNGLAYIEHNEFEQGDIVEVVKPDKNITGTFLGEKQGRYFYLKIKEEK